MTNKRKTQRFRTMQAKNSKEWRYAKIRKIVKDSNKYLFFDPYTATCFFVSKPTLLRLKTFANALSCIHESFDEYKKRVEKEIWGS